MNMQKFAANLTFLFNELPFLERFEAAKKAGFEAVEYMSPYEFDRHELKARLDQFGLAQILHNLPVAEWAAGGRGLLIFPERRDEFREGVAQASDYAAALGCKMINCLSGVAPEGREVSELHACAVENLKYAAAELGKRGIKLLIEPINHYDIPRFFLNTVEQAAAIIDETGSGNLFIQYDLYHQQRTRGELIATYAKFKDKIAHIQLADNPGRNEPGTGEINYANVFPALKAAGYDGWIGCEYKPKAATADGLGWLKKY
jgi:hydroxypyruvate isomerase